MLKNDHVLADGTYKIIVEGFPVLTIGTTDRQRSIHHFGYAIVAREKEEDFKFLFNAVKKGVRLILSKCCCCSLLYAVIIYDDTIRC